jgi:hypothetical protein
LVFYFVFAYSLKGFSAFSLLFQPLVLFAIDDTNVYMHQAECQLQFECGWYELEFG